MARRPIRATTDKQGYSCSNIIERIRCVVVCSLELYSPQSAKKCAAAAPGRSGPLFSLVGLRRELEMVAFDSGRPHRFTFLSVSLSACRGVRCVAATT